MRYRKISWVAAAFALIILLAIAVQGLSIYDYDTRQDYRYSFEGTDVHIIEGRISTGELLLDEVPAGFDTAFVELTIKTSLFGWFAEPMLEIHSEEGSVLQAMEKGGAGRRYVNLSSLFTTNPARKLSIQTKYLRIPDQPVRLLCFRNNIDPQKRVLVIAPHPDDAEIAAFGLYASHPNVWIATVTAGDAGRNTYDEVYPDHAEQALKKGELRVWNSIAVPMLGGVPPERSVNLGYYDARLREMSLTPQQPVVPKYANLSDAGYFRKMNISPLLDGRRVERTWENLVGDLEHLVKQIKPDVIITPYPRLDTHPDHKYSTGAVLEALGNLDIRSGQLLLYSNHCTTSTYVPYGPIYSGVALPPVFDEPLLFDRIYSWSLSPQQQKDKYFALEAMNDLRLDTEWRSFGGTLKYFLKKARHSLFNKDFSYYRRAVRRDEVFFVVDLAKRRPADLGGRLASRNTSFLME